MLEMKKKRRYAKAMKRLEYGTWGYAPSLFRKLTLTTRGGDDNSVERFLKDLKELRRRCAALGYEIEYAGGIGYTPKKGLVHWHGLWRIKGGYFLCPLEDTKRVAEQKIRKLWLEIHNAFEIEFDSVDSGNDLQKYIVKHILKDLMDSAYGLERLNGSKGWPRPGVKEALKLIEYFVSKGKGRRVISQDGWARVNEMEKVFCMGDNHLWRDGMLNLWVHEHFCELHDLSVTEGDSGEVGKGAGF